MNMAVNRLWQIISSRKGRKTRSGLLCLSESDMLFSVSFVGNVWNISEFWDMLMHPKIIMKWFSRKWIYLQLWSLIEDRTIKCFERKLKKVMSDEINWLEETFQAYLKCSMKICSNLKIMLGGLGLGIYTYIYLFICLEIVSRQMQSRSQVQLIINSKEVNLFIIWIIKDRPDSFRNRDHCLTLLGVV